MIPSEESCYRAILSRDGRFDGVFFVAVRTTKIYCRPICRVKAALLKNCSFLPSAAAAEAAGYRPCLRCRPELAPGFSTMEAVRRLATLTLQQIEDGALLQGSIADLADDFGVTDRHLRRVLKSEFGVSPVELAQTCRLQLARRLLLETNIPVAIVSQASGFKSLRRFHALFSARYRLTPAAFRKKRLAQPNKEIITCALNYRPPYDWPAILSFLKGRATQGVEHVTHETYARTVQIGGATGTIMVQQADGEDRLIVEISASLLPTLMPLLSRLKRLFDLNAEPAGITQALGRLARNRPGLRVPGAFDGFEVAVRAVLGQQISVRAATTLAGRFAARFGGSISTNIEGLSLLSPSAESVAAAPASEITSLGIIAQRAATILALARAVCKGELILAPAINVDAQTNSLLKIPGIGPWTAEYIAMRALAWPDAFPHTDLAIKKAMKEKNPARILAMAEKWKPWRSYAAMHLWKSLEAAK